jgi:hypothetical protein
MEILSAGYRYHVVHNNVKQRENTKTKENYFHVIAVLHRLVRIEQVRL